MKRGTERSGGADIAAILDRGVGVRLGGAAGNGPIPKILHQTYFTPKFPEAIQANVDRLRAENPHWEYRFYDDAAIERFIAEEYGEAVLARYRAISPVYGAARADLFRYLVTYRFGGVYLDIKSTADRPLDEVFGEDDGFVLSQWDNGPGRTHEIWGLHAELAGVPGGEFQQWFIACAPGHPLLRAVIERVLHNIDTYDPYRVGVGLRVVRVTGPIPYTLAMAPILHLHRHRRVADESVLGLRYSIFDYHAHHVHFKGHYSQRTTPIVGPPGSAASQAMLTGYLRVRGVLGKVRKHGRRLYRRVRGLPYQPTL